MLLSSVVAPLLVLLFSPVVMAAPVMSCRGDRDKDHRPRLNCTAAGFEHVPPGIEPTTQVLLFPLNQFSNLSWSSFAVFKDIHEIDLSQNQISVLTRSDGPILPSLSVLRLGSNQLRAVPDHCFSGSPALTKLYLQKNQLSSLTDQSFSGLSKLEILDLSNNHIQTLPERMMFPLSSIEALYLEANKIKVMPDGWFSQKEEVPYLFLSANPWACSCSLSYLHKYLEEYDYNVYVRDRLIISSDGESVICDSPESLKGRSVVKLKESDFCNGHTGSPEDISTTTALTTPASPTTPDRTAPPDANAHPDPTTISTPARSLTTVPPADTSRDDGYATRGYYKVVTWFETFQSGHGGGS